MPWERPKKWQKRQKKKKKKKENSVVSTLMFWILITDILTYPVVRIEVAFRESGPRGYRNSISGKIVLTKKK